MADIGNKYLVDPNAEVKILTNEARIQERVSRLVRLKQDIEDLEKLAIVSKRAEIKMVELELEKIRQEQFRLKQTDSDIIDV